MGICAIFKEALATIRADILDEVWQPLETECYNKNKAIDGNLWNKLWRNLDDVLSTVKQF